MSFDINRFTAIGRMTKDAELKYTASGTAIMKCYIAVGGRPVDGQSKTSFFKVIAWGKIGESIAQYLKKGIQIAIDGHLEQNVFTPTGDTKKVTETQIIADKIQILTPKKQTTGEPEFSEADDNEKSNYDNENF